MSVVALVVAVESPAMAHQVKAAVHKIAGSSIKPHSVAGNRLKKNTITGAEVKESTLGTVPKAKSAKRATALTPLAWHALPLQAPTVAYGSVERTPAYAIDAQGVVHLRGAFKGGANNATAFTLPVALEAHDLDLTIPVLCGNDGYSCYLNIDNGNVTAAASGTAPDGVVANYVSLEGVTFSGR
jgi:hypothetical protein